MRAQRWLPNASLAAVSLLALSSMPAQQSKVEMKSIPDVAPDGARMFRSYCSACHGPGGKGDGPAASALKTRPANLTRLTANHGGVFPANSVLVSLRTGGGTHGSSEMPVWGDVFRQSNYSESDIFMRTYNLVRYVESIQDTAPAPKADPVTPARLRKITDVRPSMGGEMFRSYCSSCHGVDGRGAGPAAARLKTTPPDLTHLRGPDGKFPFAKVESLLMRPDAGVHGSTEMPLWGDLFRRTGEGVDLRKLRTHNITRHIERLQQ